MASIRGGVWPTMLTLFTDEGKPDYAGMEKLVEWYLARGVDGIFAMCQSSEMFYLSLEEKLDIIKFVLRTVRGRVPVIASGHTSFDMRTQLMEMNQIADTGVDAVVFITNILATEDKSEDAFRRSVETLTEGVRCDSFGLYECPKPFKYLLSPGLLRWCAQSGRFAFLKDTCCDAAQLATRLEALKGTGMKLFNANAATLLTSLRMGAAGYSSVMANFFPELYVWLCRHFAENPAKAEALQDFLSVTSLAEFVHYPTCAKYYLQDILGTGIYCRTPTDAPFSATDAVQMEHLRHLAQRYIANYCSN